MKPRATLKKLNNWICSTITNSPRGTVVPHLPQIHHYPGKTVPLLGSRSRRRWQNHNTRRSWIHLVWIQKIKIVKFQYCFVWIVFLQKNTHFPKFSFLGQPFQNFDFSKMKRSKICSKCWTSNISTFLSNILICLAFRFIGDHDFMKNQVGQLPIGVWTCRTVNRQK